MDGSKVDNVDIRICVRFVRKLNLVQKILDLNGKLDVDVGLHKLCEQSPKLTEHVNEIVAENKKLQCDLVIAQNINHRLEEKIPIKSLNLCPFAKTIYTSEVSAKIYKGR